MACAKIDPCCERLPRLPPLAYGCHSAWNVAGGGTLGHNLELSKFLNYRSLRGGEMDSDGRSHILFAAHGFRQQASVLSGISTSHRSLHACDFAARMAPTRAPISS